MAAPGYSKAVYGDKISGTSNYEFLGFESITGYKAHLGNSHTTTGRYYGSSGAAFHEVMHLFGLSDWYNSEKERKAVGDNDMMNNGPRSKKPIMHQIHWNNWLKEVKTRQPIEGSNFIGNHFVE